MATIGVTGVLGSRIIDAYYTIFGNNKKFEKKKDVVVVGYGWAGKSFCDNLDQKKFNLHVISKTNYMLNTPKLKESIIRDTNDLMIPQTVPTFINESVKDINLKNKAVTTDSVTKYYDYLVFAVGSEVNDFNVPGVKENCYFLKNKDDLENLRTNLFDKNKFRDENDMKNTLPYQINKRIAIMGAGPAGIELAFELSKHCKDVYIIEALDKILPMFSDEAKDKVKDELQKANIKLVLGNQVSKVEPNMIYSKEKIGNDLMDRNWFYDIAIWNCGVKPNPIVSKIIHPTQNKVITYGNFQVHNLPDGLRGDENKVFAIGDIVASKEYGPPTAQNAVQQGKHLAQYFNNNFQGEDYKFYEKGKIIHTHDKLIVDSKLGVLVLPKIVKPVFDYFTG
jgi:NADH:ubiquinone reductase (non-electrogenic)